MLEKINESLSQIITQTQASFPVLGIILIILWSMYLLNLLLHKHLFILGIIPRRLRGLMGIFFAPFLHASFNHLFFNCIPLVVLSDFLLIHGLNYFLWVTLFITLLSGFLIWCFAKPGLHIGASAVITGYWALLVSDIYQQGSLTAIILGLVSLYYFAGIFLGVFPTKKGVSWEGHFFGLLSGFAISYLLIIVYSPTLN